jgi:hypothetical protein
VLGLSTECQFAEEMNAMENCNAQVLLIGGGGVVGKQAATRLRQRWEHLPILIGGRDFERATTVAAELGNAQGVMIDLLRPDLALPDDLDVGAVVMFTKDGNLNAQRFAQKRSAPFVEISSAVFEIGPQMAFHIERPRSAAVLLASNWLAGASTFAALDLASQFTQVDRVLISALLDEQDIGGHAAEADYVRQTQAGPSGLTRKDGHFVWVSGDAAVGSFHAVDERKLEAQSFGNLDVLSLSAATNSPNVTFQFAVGETSSRRQGGKFSHEILIEIDGVTHDGRSVHARRSVVHPEGQAPMTALSVCLAIKSLLGLTSGSKPLPGLYLPHVLVDSGKAVAELRGIAAVIQDTWDQRKLPMSIRK